MRRLALLTAPIFATIWLFACEDDPNNGTLTILLPDGGGYDANTPAYDGNVPPPDVTTDVAVGPLPVTVVVANVMGTPAANVTVVFHDADGAVIETKTTDAQGKVSSGIDPVPAMATVAFVQPGSGGELFTLTGLQGGDVLPVTAPLTATLGQVDITLPGQFLDAGGPTYNYYASIGGCDMYSGSASAPISISIEPYCYTGAGAVLVAGTDEGDNIVAYALKKPLMAPTDGGVGAVTTDEWAAPPVDVTVSVSNTTNASGWAYFTPIANATAFNVNSGDLGDAYQHTFKAPPGTFSDAYNATVEFTTDQYSTRVLGKRVAPTGTISFDANDLPVLITEATLDATSLERPVVTWSGNMSAMKGGVVRFRWNDDPNERSIRWSVVVPPNAAATGSVKAPLLPASLSALLPPADGGADVWEDRPSVDFIDSDLVPDYATWKKVQGVLFSVPAFENVWRTVLPANGTFKATHYQVYVGG